VRITFREKITPIMNSLIALLVGFIGGIIAIYVAGYDVPLAMQKLYETALGNPFVDPFPLTVTLTYAAPLMLSGLGFAICARAGIFNIGVEGQIYMAAMGAVIATALPIAFTPLHTATIIGSAIFFALIWAVLPAVLKVWRNVNEVVVTIMANNIARWLTDYVIFKFYAYKLDPTKSIPIPEYARPPLLIPRTDLSWNIFISVGVVLFVYFLLWYTGPGYELRVAGMNPNAARYAGINPKKAIMISFLITGTLAGVAGYEKVAGIPPSYAVNSGLSNLVGLGFDGIAVALMGMNHPIGIIFAAILMGALSAGSKGLNLVGIPKEIVFVFQGIIVMSLSVPSIVDLVKRRLGKKVVE
jgi:simple sugar transport system permease protein